MENPSEIFRLLRERGQLEAAIAFKEQTRRRLRAEGVPGREAKAHWARFDDQHLRGRSALPACKAAPLYRLGAYAARLSLLAHLVRWAAGDPAVDPEMIDHRSIDIGIALAKWAAAEIGLRAKRAPGEMLAKMEKNRGERPPKTGNSVLPVSSLSGLGIRKMQSGRP